MVWMVDKIISGGQTGVDTAALIYARSHGIPYGGWVPKGRTNEAGPIEQAFTGLVEAHDAIPDTRTRLNVGSSDATLIIWDGPRASPGTSATARFAEEMDRPCLEVQLSDGLEACAQQIRDWLARVDPVVLNVAGPRESEAPGIQDKAGRLLRMALADRRWRLENAYSNIRHWDNIRWIVPFWFFSAVMAAGFLLDADKLHYLKYYLIGMALIGFACANLVRNTMIYHDKQREMLIDDFGAEYLDTISDIHFEEKKPFGTATQIFFWLVVLFSCAMAIEGIFQFLGYSLLDLFRTEVPDRPESFFSD